MNYPAFNPQPKPEKTDPKPKKPIHKKSVKRTKEDEKKVYTVAEYQQMNKEVKSRNRKEKADKPKKRKNPFQILKKDFDVIYSLVVKMEPANSEGIVQCYCGQFLHWTNANNSHFIPRSTAPSIIHDRMNTHPSCVPCNGFKEGNRASYIPWMNKKYGVEAVALLEQRGQKKSGNGVFEYTVMMDKYIDLFLSECDRLNYEPSKAQLKLIAKYKMADFI